MWLVASEEKGSSDDALENFSSMAIYCSLSPPCTFYPSANRPPAILQIGHLFVPLAPACAAPLGWNFHSRPMWVDSFSSPKYNPGFTASLKPSLTFPSRLRPQESGSPLLLHRLQA